MEKSCFLIYESKNLIDSNPTINDTTTPTITSTLNVNLGIFKIAAPAMIGTDNKNVNLVAALLDKPINLAAKMVVPLLENPGKIARA